MTRKFYSKTGGMYFFYLYCMYGLKYLILNVHLLDCKTINGYKYMLAFNLLLFSILTACYPAKG